MLLSGRSWRDEGAAGGGRGDQESQFSGMLAAFGSRDGSVCSSDSEPAWSGLKDLKDPLQACYFLIFCLESNFFFPPTKVNLTSYVFIKQHLPSERSRIDEYSCDFSLRYFTAGHKIPPTSLESRFSVFVQWMVQISKAFVSSYTSHTGPARGTSELRSKYIYFFRLHTLMFMIDIPAYNCCVHK